MAREHQQNAIQCLNTISGTSATMFHSAKGSQTQRPQLCQEILFQIEISSVGTL